MSDAARRAEQMGESPVAARAPVRRAGHPSGRRTQWSRARVLAAVEQWSGEVGVAPRVYEWAPSTARAIGRDQSAGVQKWRREYPRWPGTTAVYAYWGSWRAVLNEAGLSTVQPMGMPLRERIATFEQLQHLPDQVIADILGVHELTVARHYRRAERCPSCAGLKLTADSAVCGLCAQRTKRPPPSRASIIAAIQAWVGETGTRPVAADWQLCSERWRAEYPRWPATHQVQEQFGSWNAALIAAGVDAHPRRWSREEIVTAARSWSQLHGRPPRGLDWRTAAGDEPRPSGHVVVEVFGSWNAMLAAAELATARRAWSRQQIVDALDAWNAVHGGPPTQADWARPGTKPAHPAPSRVHKTFGSWNAMLLAGGVQPRHRVWSCEEILTACAAFQVRAGRAIRAMDFDDPANGLPSIKTLRRKIGNTTTLRLELKHTRHQRAA